MLIFYKIKLFIKKKIMNIDKIITEEINYFLFEDDEQSSNDSEAKSNKGTDQYAAVLEKENEDGELNIRKLASKMTGIPTSTKDKSNVNKLNSVQSLLRKKIKGEKGASGGRFHLTKSEVSDIAQTRDN